MADAYNDVAVTLIVVFIMQTMLMPLLILWGLIKLPGYVLSPVAPWGAASNKRIDTGKSAA